MGCCRLQKRKSNNANFNFLKITTMKKVKVFIAMIAVALGGLIIWSCTQDEMENRQGTYRYSAEEIATLRAMAEKYGVPEVVFETESGIPLPRLEEMEETFKNFGLIKASLTAQLEVIDSTSHSMVFKTKKSHSNDYLPYPKA